MHNMAIDSVDYTHYTRVYTICEDVSAIGCGYYTHRLSLIYECV